MSDTAKAALAWLRAMRHIYLSEESGPAAEESRKAYLRLLCSLDQAVSPANGLRAREIYLRCLRRWEEA